MKSLTHVQFFQNGIKEEGMAELIQSFASNPCLEHIKVNDNLIKNSAPILVDIVPTLKELKHIDISDSLLGHEHSLNFFKALSNISVEEVICNYNEIEKKSTQKMIFDICLGMNSLRVVEIKGNDIDPSLWKKFKKEVKSKIAKFEPYSDEEEALIDEEEDLIEEIEKKLVLDN